MSRVGAEADLLVRIEAYSDAAPRPAADVEEHGALTLFVSRIPWRFYGRPRLGLADEDVGADDVAAVRARQRELGVREAFEWVHETTPSLAGAAVAAGLEVLRVPLLALEPARWSLPPAPAGIELRMLGADDPALAASQAAVELAFAADREGAAGPRAEPEDEGTAGIRDAGPAARDLAVARLGDLGFLRERLRRGLSAIAVAESPVDGVLAAGSHQLVGDVTEITGVGTLPAARRRGIGAAVTARLVGDARERGAALVFLSAAGDDVARLYERLGFARVGTACFGYPAER
jgi:N-acetylglutamate synthase-like GNAT family acetyltransferase